MALRTDSRRMNGSSEGISGHELILPERDLGNGAQSLYAYYLPTYRRSAESRGESSWLMKVSTTSDSLENLMAHHRGMLPEVPAVAIVVRTDDADLLQRLVHLVLDMRGRRSTSGGGNDWFVTNGEEISAIYSFANGDSMPTLPAGRSYEDAPVHSFEAPEATETNDGERAYWGSAPTVLPDTAEAAFERLN